MAKDYTKEFRFCGNLAGNLKRAEKKKPILPFQVPNLKSGPLQIPG